MPPQSNLTNNHRKIPAAAAAAAARSSCLLQALRHDIGLGNLAGAVDRLPVLARRGIRPDIRTLSSLLRLCLISSSTLHLARHIHLHLKLTLPARSLPSYTELANHILHLHFALSRPDDAYKLFDKMPHPNIFTHNAMLAGYARLGMPSAARRFFYRMPNRDLVSWNTMIVALARGGRWREAVRFYFRMRSSFDKMNGYTYSGVLMACARLGKITLTRQFHGQILQFGFLSNDITSNSLIDAYAKCGDMDDAKKVFDEMPFRDVHAWTSLVSGYANSGDVQNSRDVFDKMPRRNLVSWSAMICGYIQNGLCEKAVHVFIEMMESGLSPDRHAVSFALCACASIACLRLGKQVHCYLIRSHLRPNELVLSSLMDMYSKCGDISRSWLLFQSIPQRSRGTVMWNTMISIFGQHGLGKHAMKLFYMMIKSGAVPDAKTFVVILTACNHSRLVIEGIRLFRSMTRDHKISPNGEHLACFVELLGCAGLFEELKLWISGSRFRSSAFLWRKIFEEGRIRGNVELMTEAAEHLIELVPQWSDASALANAHAYTGRQGSLEKVTRLMEERGMGKDEDVSVIEVDNCMHTFRGYDGSHPFISDIYQLLDLLDCHVEDLSACCHSRFYGLID